MMRKRHDELKGWRTSKISEVANDDRYWSARANLDMTLRGDFLGSANIATSLAMAVSPSGVLKNLFLKSSSLLKQQSANPFHAGPLNR